VNVENLSGHKFPTAFPSRRAWLHFTVHDHGGRVVFESGALRPDGSIVGNDNDADPRRFEPHYAAINSTEQVEIYGERRKGCGFRGRRPSDPVLGRDRSSAGTVPGGCGTLVSADRLPVGEQPEAVQLR